MSSKAFSDSQPLSSCQQDLVGVKHHGGGVSHHGRRRISACVILHSCAAVSIAQNAAAAPLPRRQAAAAQDLLSKVAAGPLLLQVRLERGACP